MRATSNWITSPGSGVRFNVAGINEISDLHGDIVDPQLIVFLAGNQYMVTGELVGSFQEAYPQYERIYVQTLPPGIMAQQVEQGALMVGNLRITHRPDVFAAEKIRIDQLDESLERFQHSVDYAANRLEIMVSQGNPKNVTGLKSLERDEVRVSMPNPAWEDIGEHILAACRKAGGEALVRRIMEEKQAEGSTYLAFIHHRETPRRILRGESDAGPVWHTEVYYQQVALGNPIEGAPIPDELNERAVYTAASVRTAAHKEAAEDFLDFLTGERGQAIYRRFGFEAVSETGR